jgi:hypothetical protein
MAVSSSLTEPLLSIVCVNRLAYPGAFIDQDLIAGRRSYAVNWTSVACEYRRGQVYSDDRLSRGRSVSSAA